MPVACVVATVALVWGAIILRTAGKWSTPAVSAVANVNRAKTVAESAQETLATKRISASVATAFPSAVKWLTCVVSAEVNERDSRQSVLKVAKREVIKCMVHAVFVVAMAQAAPDATVWRTAGTKLTNVASAATQRTRQAGTNSALTPAEY